MDLYTELWDRLDLGVYGDVNGIAFFSEPVKASDLDLREKLAIVYTDCGVQYVISFARKFDKDLMNKLDLLYDLYKNDITNILGHKVALIYTNIFGTKQQV